MMFLSKNALLKQKEVKGKHATLMIKEIGKVIMSNLKQGTST